MKSSNKSSHKFLSYTCLFLPYQSFLDHFDDLNIIIDGPQPKTMHESNGNLNVCIFILPGIIECYPKKKKKSECI